MFAFFEPYFVFCRLLIMSSDSTELIAIYCDVLSHVAVGPERKGTS